MSLTSRILVHNPANGAEHLVHGLTQILPAVSREQDQTAASRPLQIFLGIVLGHRGAQSINGGVTGDKKCGWDPSPPAAGSAGRSP